MKPIPIRSIQTIAPEISNFMVRQLPLAPGLSKMTQGLHRHDFFFILFVKNASGVHEIDFTTHKVKNYSIFFVRPGQVHQMSLNPNASGYLIQFNRNFYSEDKTSGDLLQRVVSRNVCQLNAKQFE